MNNIQPRGKDGKFVSSGKPDVDEAMRIAVKNGEVALTAFIRKAVIGLCWDYAENLTQLEKFKFFQLNFSEIVLYIHTEKNETQVWKLTMRDVSVLSMDATRMVGLGLNE